MEKSELVAALGGVLKRDLDIASRTSRAANAGDNDSRYLESVATSAAMYAATMRIAYTAFDGDHQQLVPLMRRKILQDGLVPANPDSILDYKETVQARQNKESVLLDDLAILRGCDELVIFTDIAPDLGSVGALAEGVLVELAFFLKRKPGSPVTFVPVSALLEGLDQAGSLWPHKYDTLINALPADIRPAVVRLANSGTRVDRRLPRILYSAMDVLDFKYARFALTAAYYRSSSSASGARRLPTAPLVPFLAVDRADLPPGEEGSGSAVLCWIALMRLASEMVVYPPMEPGRSDPALLQLLQTAWLRSPPPRQLDAGDWSTLRIPKVSQRDKWPLTEREQLRLRGDEK